MSHNFMSCIRGNVKKGLGQSGLFFLTRSCIINEQECLTIYYVTHSGERKEELRRRLTETRRKIFKINKELTASVVMIEMFDIQLCFPNHRGLRETYFPQQTWTISQQCSRSRGSFLTCFAMIFSLIQPFSYLKYFANRQDYYRIRCSLIDSF